MRIRRSLTLAAATGVTLLALTGTALALGAGSDDTTASTAPPTTTSTPTTSMSTASTSTTPGMPTTPLLPAAVDRATAERAALAQVGGGRVVKVEREAEHGRDVWEVDVSTASGVREVHVDAATGAVTRDRSSDDRSSDDRGSDDHGGRHGGDDRDH